MNCDDARTLIHAYLDGELDLAGSLEIERHLHECTGCSQQIEGHQVLASALKTGEYYYPASSALRKRVQTSLREADRGNRPRAALPWNWLAIAASLALIALIAWSLGAGRIAPSGTGLVAQEVVASHTRSLMAQHLTDVASSSEHTVKPWFAGKLDFSPVVPDFADQGFPLVGGRLDYLDNRPVAALVYRYQQHTINLFTWPSAGQPDSATHTLVQQGYNLAYWTQGGMTYWAISDLNAAELQHFVQLVQKGAASTTATH